MNVKELYLDSLRFEESSLAHYIHHLLAEQKISLDDNISKLDLDQADHQKVAEMIQNNVLGFHKIGIYSLKMNQKDFVLSMQPARKRQSNSIPKHFINPR
nr:hypothetical protein [Neobacillus sp. Marseille-Q6967]